MKNIDLNFFPGWTRKSVTFTIDDGNLKMDTEFIRIVKPYGIKGTFNITSDNSTKHNNPELIRATYRGFEIANHVKRHPHATLDSDAPIVASPDVFDEETADKTKYYRIEGLPEGAYWKYEETSKRWSIIADAKAYIALVEACEVELEEIFGKGSVRGFVWPYYTHRNSEIIEYVKKKYGTLRDAGKPAPMEDKTFALPKDRTNWQYNARHANLLERAKEYEALCDGGELKWFSFGVHSWDFERDGLWGDLEEFCEKYGNRPEDYWYASVGEIFDYEDAVKAVEISDDMVKNPTDVTLYIKVDGKRITLAPYSEIKL